MSDDRPGTPAEVLFEVGSKFDVFRLEYKVFVPEDGGPARPFLWVSRSKAGGKSQGVSIRGRELDGFIAALNKARVRFESAGDEQRARAEDHGRARNEEASDGPTWLSDWKHRQTAKGRDR